jgi:putative SOS response-associated peptidase YedK
MFFNKRKKGGGSMCGRYNFSEEALQSLRELVTPVDDEALRAGDISPSMEAPVLLEDKGVWPTAARMTWGFPLRAGSGRAGERGKLLINCRCETAMEKPMFRESIRKRRLVIPAGSFYEWNSRGEKAEFLDPDGPLLFLAGIWQVYDGVRRFVILTTEANPSVRPVHPRMPLLLKKEELPLWAGSGEDPSRILTERPQALTRRQKYEQQTFF